jgi:dipeptidase
MMKRTLISLSILLLWMQGFESRACTNYIVTRGASTDGSVMVSYSADSHVLYGELYHWSAGVWPAGTMIDIYEWDTGDYLGQIEQAPQTYNVIGNMNEWQVTIGETTFGGLDELGRQPGAIMDYGSLIYVTLQRARNAREAIKIMAELVEKYGYYSSGESFSIADPNEAWILEMIGKGKEITVNMKALAKEGAQIQKALKPLNGKTFYSDEAFLEALGKTAGEAFAKEHGKRLISILEKGVKGAVWVALRIPDGMVSGHANQARITTFPLENGVTSISSKNLDKISDPSVECVYAHDVISFAKQRGYINDKVTDQAFSFSDTYAPVSFGGARFCEIRVWSMFNKVHSGMNQYWEYVKGHIEHDPVTGYASNRMPLWIKPEKKISVRDVMDFMRDHLEGTELDMRLDLGAGPYGNPYRWRPLTFKVDGQEYLNERATATQQTGFSFVAQMRSWLPREIGGIFWFSVDDADFTVYYPVYCSSTRAADKFARGYGKMMEFKDDAAFWVFNQVSNFGYTRYSDIHPEVRRMQDKLENFYIDFTPSVDAYALKLYNIDKEKAIEFLTDYSVNTGNNLVMQWKDFYAYLFTKYMDGNIKVKDGNRQNPKVSQPGYGEKWYRKIVEDTGDKLRVKGSAH